MQEYIIEYENGAVRYYTGTYAGALNYAENNNLGYEFTISEYNEED